MRLDNEVGGKAVQVRVTQGNEPRHFIKMFQGELASNSLLSVNIGQAYGSMTDRSDDHL